MIANHGLHKIRTGEATPKEARATLRGLIATEGDAAFPGIYTALRGWTWKAMQLRRFDDELTEWFKILQASSVIASDRSSPTGYFLEGLSHLVEESIRYAASHNREQLMRRSHVAEVLGTLRRHNGRIERDKLEAEMKLSPSRLSQVLKELQITGLIDRETDRQRAIFVMTDFGREQLEAWEQSQASQPDADSDMEETELELAKPVFKRTAEKDRETLAPNRIKIRGFTAHRPTEIERFRGWVVQNSKPEWEEVDAFLKEMPVATPPHLASDEMRFEPLQPITVTRELENV